MNANRHWNLEIHDQRGPVKKINISNSDKLNSALEMMNPPKIFRTADSQIALLHPDYYKAWKLLRSCLTIDIPVPLEYTFCPLGLICRSLAEITGVSGFIYQERIGAIVLTKHLDNSYSYVWVLKDPDLESEIIEELRLAMLMMVTRCCFWLFPFVVRNCGTGDTRYWEPSKEMHDHVTSAEQTRFTAFNSDMIATENDERRRRDAEMLFRNL
jgi:hypothetical protein